MFSRRCERNVCMKKNMTKKFPKHKNLMGHNGCISKRKLMEWWLNSVKPVGLPTRFNDRSIQLRKETLC